MKNRPVSSSLDGLGVESCVVSIKTVPATWSRFIEGSPAPRYNRIANLNSLSSTVPRQRKSESYYILLSIATLICCMPEIIRKPLGWRQTPSLLAQSDNCNSNYKEKSHFFGPPRELLVYSLIKFPLTDSSSLENLLNDRCWNTICWQEECPELLEQPAVVGQMRRFT